MANPLATLLGLFSSDVGGHPELDKVTKEIDAVQPTGKYEEFVRGVNEAIDRASAAAESPKGQIMDRLALAMAATPGGRGGPGGRFPRGRVPGSSRVVGSDVPKVGRPSPLWDKYTADQVKSMFEAGANRREMAEKFKVGKSTVDNWARQLGYSEPKSSILNDPEVVKSFRKMYSEGKSFNDIAESLSVSKSTVLRMLDQAKAEGVELPRPPTNWAEARRRGEPIAPGRRSGLVAGAALAGEGGDTEQPQYSNEPWSPPPTPKPLPKPPPRGPFPPLPHGAPEGETPFSRVSLGGDAARRPSVENLSPFDQGVSLSVDDDLIQRMLRNEPVTPWEKDEFERAKGLREDRMRPRPEPQPPDGFVQRQGTGTTPFSFIGGIGDLINPENWDRMLNETPPSQNIEDRRGQGQDGRQQSLGKTIEGRRGTRAGTR